MPIVPDRPYGELVQAVIFDLDGVLINSEPIWDEVRRAIADAAGRPWPAGATRAMQGMSTREWSSYLAATVGVPGRPAQLAEQVIEEVEKRYAADLPLIPGAREAVLRMHARFRLGLASSSPRRLIDTVLAAAGMTELFEVTVSTEEVPAGKPSPAVYLEAVRRLGVPAAQTAAVEDSSNGLRAAHAAGLVVVALPHDAFPPAPDALALAAVRVHALAELTPRILDGYRAGAGG
jgi:HAD superfamily hydrolase (TIGR01509 family)